MALIILGLTGLTAIFVLGILVLFAVVIGGGILLFVVILSCTTIPFSLSHDVGLLLISVDYTEMPQSKTLSTRSS